MTARDETHDVLKVRLGGTRRHIAEVGETGRRPIPGRRTGHIRVDLWRDSGGVVERAGAQQGAIRQTRRVREQRRGTDRADGIADPLPRCPQA